MHIFIDESGSFQNHDRSGIIVFAAVATANAAALRRIIRRTRRAKLHTRKEKRLGEIKGSSATDKFKNYFYRQLSNVDVSIYVIILRMSDIRDDYWKQKTGVLRLKLTIKLLEAAGVREHEPIEVVLDRQPLPGMGAGGFRIALEAEFGGTIAHPRYFHACFKDSQEDLGIQVADFVAHDIALKYTRSNLRWYDLFKDRIKAELNGAEVRKYCRIHKKRGAPYSYLPA